MAHWILQSGFEYESGWQDMIDTLDRFNIPYSIHKVVPFVGELIPEPELDTKNVVCIGSYSMRHYAKKKGWHPGVYDLEPFNFIVQKSHWKDNMLNYDSEVVQFKDVKFDDGPRFIRPIDDTKVFAGRVFDVDEFKDWQNKVVNLKETDGSSLTSSTIVQVCKPKKIVQEVRCWIVDQEIVTSSVYKVGSRVTYSPIVDDRFTTFAGAMAAWRISLDYWAPLDAFVIDVCELEDKTMKIVELNTINSCGFYAADVPKLVLHLDAAANYAYKRN